MKKYRARATMTTFAEITIEAANEQEAYEIADELDGGEFIEIAGVGGWDIEILPPE